MEKRGGGLRKICDQASMLPSFTVAKSLVFVLSKPIFHQITEQQLSNSKR